MQLSSIVRDALSWDLKTITPFLPSELVLELSNMKKGFIANPRSKRSLENLRDIPYNAIEKNKPCICYNGHDDAAKHLLKSLDWYGIVIDTVAGEPYKPGLYILRAYNKSYLEML